jgi:hypothetical protein
MTVVKNIFDKSVSDEIIQRINSLSPKSTGIWGKMSASQMLAHCNVTYEMAYENTHKKPGAFLKFILKTFVKQGVVNEIPYPKNSRTAPAFIISDQREFELEKARLIEYVRKTQELGSAYFEGKESHSFGKLTAKEWNNMFYKHLNHHLFQFNV